MLTYKTTGIQKFIFDRICQIHDEIVFHDPQYREMGEEPAELMKHLNAKLAWSDQEILDRFDCARTEQRKSRMRLSISYTFLKIILILKYISRNPTVQFKIWIT